MKRRIKASTYACFVLATHTHAPARTRTHARTHARAGTRTHMLALVHEMGRRLVEEGLAGQPAGSQHVVHLRGAGRQTAPGSKYLLIVGILYYTRRTHRWAVRPRPAASESLPSHSPSEPIPSHSPSESLPGHSPSESLPSHSPSESLPSHAARWSACAGRSA